MSLPSYVVFYDENDKEIHRGFINVGWWFCIDSLKTEVSNVIKELDIEDFSYFKAYGEKYTREDWKIGIDVLYKQIYKRPEPIKQDRANELLIRLRKLDQDTIDSRTLLAEDIIGVQPMTGFIPEVFKIKYKYKKDTSMNIEFNGKTYNIQRTCFACPEQYDVYIENTQVGYIRLRFGELRVDCPECMQETVLHHEFENEWKGCFSSDEDVDIDFSGERKEYLMKSIEAIDGWAEKQTTQI